MLNCIRILGLIVIFTSCINTFSEESNSVEYYFNPTTSNERNFRRELLNQGFDSTEFFVPIIGTGPKGKRNYRLKLHLFRKIPQSSFDSLKAVRDDIANKLYTSVISDSLLVDINQITVDIIWSESKVRGFNLYGTYYKDSLEKWNGFKVIEVGEKRYERK